MDKQKQLNEMHQILLSAGYDWWKTAPNGKTKSEYEAECFYNAGYRKESETAKEIYEILGKWAWKLKNEKGRLGNFAFGIETAMQEIKEKYSLQVGNFKLVELKKGKKDGT